MPIDATVRVSFQSSSRAHHDISATLVGDGYARNGPFSKRGNTATYSVTGGSDSSVCIALSSLMKALEIHADDLDFASITLTRYESSDPPTSKSIIKQ